VLKKNENSHEKKMGQLDTVFRKTVEGMKLQDLIHIKKLGEGQFGEVFLCYSKKTNTYYALKCISREKIAKFNLERHTIQEKGVLEMINFPLIIKLYRTFQDKSCIYFLLSYCQGLELFDVIR
jgi:cGMP-dependent protein kinase